MIELMDVQDRVENAVVALVGSVNKFSAEYDVLKSQLASSEERVRVLREAIAFVLQEDHLEDLALSLEIDGCISYATNLRTDSARLKAALAVVEEGE